MHPIPLPPRPRRSNSRWCALLLAAGIAVLTIARAADRPADDPPVGWWREATFYEIFVRSFADAARGPLARDGIGDLQGLIEHLDYLNDGRGPAGNSLGITAVWLMPIQPSPSYHGYDVTDYFAVNPQYGDVALMKTFVAEAHRRGIRVIIDLVLNHCSAQHPLFLQARSSDPAQAAEARKLFRFVHRPENMLGPWKDRAWHPAGDDFYYGVFTSEMPDWNFRAPAVTEHHRRAAAFWLREVGVDGFRLDAVRYLLETGDQLEDTEETRQWLREFTAYCHQLEPGAFIIGENTGDIDSVARGIRSGALDSEFEFELAAKTIESIRKHDPSLLTDTLKRLDRTYDGDSPWSAFLTNHDQERVHTQLGASNAQTRLAAEVLFTLPGTLFIYYGEELGLSGAKPDPELRTPMPWTPQSPNAGFAAPDVKPWHALTADFARENVSAETADAGSLLTLYRRLIRLRAGSPALRHGRRVGISTSESQVYATMRATENEIVLVIGNFSDAVKSGATLTVKQSPLRATWKAREALADAPLPSPDLNADGGFTSWIPFPELAPESLHVIRWTR